MVALQEACSQEEAHGGSTGLPALFCFHHVLFWSLVLEVGAMRREDRGVLLGLSEPAGKLWACWLFLEEFHSHPQMHTGDVPAMPF